MKRIKVWAALVCMLAGAIGSGCASEDLETLAEGAHEVEPLGTHAEALTTISCATSSSHQCWVFHNNAQSSTAFDVAVRNNAVTWAFADAKDTRKVYVHSPGTIVGFMSYPTGQLPSPTLSISIYGAIGKDFIVVLGTDSVMRTFRGNLSNSPAAGNFDTEFASQPPTTTNGGTISISQIATVNLPNIFAASPQTIALAGNQIYCQVGNRWSPASGCPALAGLPSRSWKTISVNRGAGGGATFLTTTNEVWRAMSGTMALSGTVTYNPPLKADPLFIRGSSVGIAHLGGHYVITSAGDGSCALGGCSGDGDRIYSYDFATASWSRFFGGNLPFYPASVSDLGMCSTSAGGSTSCFPGQTPPTACGSNPCNKQYPYFNRIVDVGPFGPTLHHVFSWILPFRP